MDQKIHLGNIIAYDTLFGSQMGCKYINYTVNKMTIYSSLKSFLFFPIKFGEIWSNWSQNRIMVLETWNLTRRLNWGWRWWKLYKFKLWTPFHLKFVPISPEIQNDREDLIFLELHNHMCHKNTLWPCDRKTRPKIYIYNPTP